jgi:hypothetical protein
MKVGVWRKVIPEIRWAENKHRMIRWTIFVNIGLIQEEKRSE